MDMVAWLALPVAVLGAWRAGADDVSERAEMVATQLVARGISNPRVLAAMAKVPRQEFVPAGSRRDAHADGPLPIGYGQTISQPYIVALMTELLDIRPGSRVLEIGTGSGYQAAVIAELGADLCTIDIVEPLALRARETLERLGYRNVRVKAGDGFSGWPDAAPFDAIIVTCAPDDVPPELIGQLREGGKLVIPVGPRNAVQELLVLEKSGKKIRRQSVAQVRFVPMIRGAP